MKSLFTFCAIFFLCVHACALVKVYGGYVTGIMGDEDNPQEERIDSVIEILSGAAEEVRWEKNARCGGEVFPGARSLRPKASVRGTTKCSTVDARTPMKNRLLFQNKRELYSLRAFPARRRRHPGFCRRYSSWPSSFILTAHCCCRRCLFCVTHSSRRIWRSWASRTCANPTVGLPSTCPSGDTPSGGIARGLLHPPKVARRSSIAFVRKKRQKARGTTGSVDRITSRIRASPRSPKISNSAGSSASHNKGNSGSRGEQ